MNFWFEMAINAVEVTLILSFLVQYFGYRMACPAKYIWTALFDVLSFGSVAFFSWGKLYEGYASLVQILINIAFCCILLRGSILQKIFVSAFTMGLVAVIATFTALLVAKLSGNNVTLLLSRFNSVRIISILITKLLFFVITRIILRVKENGKIEMAGCYPAGSDSDIIYYYDYADDVRGDTGTAYSKYCILCGVHRIGAEYPDLFPVCSIGAGQQNPDRNGAARAAERMPAGKRQGH